MNHAGSSGSATSASGPNSNGNITSPTTPYTAGEHINSNNNSFASTSHNEYATYSTTSTSGRVSNGHTSRPGSVVEYGSGSGGAGSFSSSSSSEYRDSMSRRDGRDFTASSSAEPANQSLVNLATVATAALSTSTSASTTASVSSSRSTSDIERSPAANGAMSNGPGTASGGAHVSLIDSFSSDRRYSIFSLSLPSFCHKIRLWDLCDRSPTRFFDFRGLVFLCIRAFLSLGPRYFG